MTEGIITVNLKEKSYKIYIKPNILSYTGKYLNELNLSKKILIITQDKVPNKYLKTIRLSLEKSGFTVFPLILKSGEENKNLDSLLKIIKFAIENKFERNDSFCALGGGVVSDLVGFAASIYYRGLNFISIPTTLLAMVDAAVGGKTAINIKEGKNLLGTFYQPKIVIVDPSCLKTLLKREFLVGMGEVVKYALLEKTAKVKFNNLQYKSFFSFLKKNKKRILRLDQKSILNAITYSVKLKAYIVSKDEKESGLRAVLNLGHTFAHGIEQAYNYKKYTHGEAVSIGMCFASRLAERHKLISKELTDEIIGLVSEYGLPTKLEANAPIQKITNAMFLDKKVRDGKLRFILPYKNIGFVKIVSDIKIDEIKELLTD